MKRYTCILFCACLLACSPYKKVTLSMGERLTTRWKGATEGAVIGAIGSYKDKVTDADGYMIRFDFSYPMRVSELKDSKGLQFRASASNQPTSLTPRTNMSMPANSRNAVDSVIKFMDFYFDKTQHVRFVDARGYDDSVYYVKRK